MEYEKPRVAIAHGDTNGIGYELIFKTFAEPEMLDICTPIIYGSPKIAAYHRKALSMQANFSIINHAEEAHEGRVNMLPCFDEEIKVEIGTPTKESRTAAVKALTRAIDDYHDGLYDVLVACPTDRNHIVCDGGDVVTTESSKGVSLRNFIKQHTSCGDAGIDMFISSTMRIASATGTVGIKDATETLTKAMVEKAMEAMNDSLRRDFTFSKPRIAVMTLNPNSDKEEREIIAPAIEELWEKGLTAFGPFTADELFAARQYDAFDGIVTMYADQAAIPFMTLSPDSGICFSSGLPMICTTPAHDALFSIAGTGQANEQSLRNAIYAAIDILRNRAIYDEATENPLPKLFHDKHDDGEKTRPIQMKEKPFAAKDKHEQPNQGQHDRPGKERHADNDSGHRTIIQP